MTLTSNKKFSKDKLQHKVDDNRKEINRLIRLKGNVLYEVDENIKIPSMPKSVHLYVKDRNLHYRYCSKLFLKYDQNELFILLGISSIKVENPLFIKDINSGLIAIYSSNKKLTRSVNYVFDKNSNSCSHLPYSFIIIGNTDSHKHRFIEFKNEMQNLLFN